MGNKLIQIILLVGLQFLAFWGFFRWYFFRVIDSKSDLLVLMPILIVLFILVWLNDKKGNCVLNIHGPAFIIFGYSILYPFCPPLILGILVALSFGLTLSGLFRCKSLDLGLCGLLLLSLPLIQSMQFYVGYPLRVLVSLCTAFVLRFSGLQVEADGAVLLWGNQHIWIDAPCSGVKMIWAIFILCFSLAFLYQFSHKKTMLLAVISSGLIVSANIFRASALFFIEANIIQGPDWLHPSVGILIFLLFGIALWWLCLKVVK